MLHRPYSPDLAPSDYYLFQSLQNSLNGKTFNDDEAVKSHLVQFSVNKDQKFYERGMIKLPERWQKVIEQNGKYIIDWSSFLVLKKNVFNLCKRIGNYFWDNSILGGQKMDLFAPHGAIKSTLWYLGLLPSC